MGKLLYGGGLEVIFPDRTLAHLQGVIAAKLRLGEGFFLSWNSPGGASGNSRIWLSPRIPLMLRFDGAAIGPLNARWIELLRLSANSQGGLYLMDEPVEVVAGEFAGSPDDGRHKGSLQ